MVSFKGLDRANVSDRTARFYFDEIPGSPWLEVRPATQSNSAYFNAMLARDTAMMQPKNGTPGQSGRTRGRATVRTVGPSELEQNRRSDRDLYPKHVVVGMGGWIDDATGAEVPYSQESAAELLQQLTDHLFDQLRNFCACDANFMEDLPTAQEVEAAKGN